MLEHKQLGEEELVWIIASQAVVLTASKGWASGSVLGGSGSIRCNSSEISTELTSLSWYLVTNPSYEPL